MLGVLDLFPPFAAVFGGAGGTPALEAPTLSFGAPVDAPTTRTVVLTVTAPGSWPGGVTVQLQRRIGAAAFANDGAPITTTRTFVLTRGVSSYTVDVRGIASAGGSPADSAASSTVSVFVPALTPTEIAPLADATPLTCEVALFPGSPEAVTATAGGSQLTLVGRADSDNVLRITNIKRAIEATTITPTTVAYALEGPTGVIVSGTITGAAGVFRTGISRLAFVPSFGTLVLRLTLTAPDSTITTISFIVPQGVRA